MDLSFSEIQRALYNNFTNLVFQKNPIVFKKIKMFTIC